MQTQTNNVTRQRNGSFIRADAYTPAPIVSEQPVFTELVTCSRSGKRQKPIDFFLPRRGTASSSYVRRHTMLQKACSGTLGLWTPYGPNSYREFSLINSESYDSVEGLLPLYTASDFLPLIQNKILSEIVSAKSQLPVDLIELGKTRTMLIEAATDLLRMYRDVRAGMPFAAFARMMRTTGFRSAAGKRWLEFIYGWVPTVSGAFDSAEVIASHLQAGAIVTGRVTLKAAKMIESPHYTYATKLVTNKVRASGYYQYTIRDPKLLKLSQLGFTNPLAIAWELLPWSFVLDWFVDVGGYINRMDWALGIGDFFWQYSYFNRMNGIITYHKHPVLPGVIFNKQKPGIISVDCRYSRRDLPTTKLVNSFKGLKRFSNETVRLTSAVALLDQQRLRIKRFR